MANKKEVKKEILSVRFDEQYKKLKEGVEALRTSDLDNIDDLVPIVEETTKAYKECKSRLDAVEALLKKALATEIEEK